MFQLDCLVIRQPYASMIAYGNKRWEFRKYDTTKKGKIGIFASWNKPWISSDSPFIGKENSFPYGALLAFADLEFTFYLTNKDLPKYTLTQKTVELHGNLYELLDEPIGEPRNDVIKASKKPNWESFVWSFNNVKSLKTPLVTNKRSKSTWIKIGVNEEVLS